VLAVCGPCVRAYPALPRSEPPGWVLHEVSVSAGKVGLG
jgi:hypothetical protein